MKRHLIVLFVVATALAGQGVYIPDLNLKSAIEETLGVVDPTAEDMLALTSLDASLRAIVDLTGLEYAKNLRYLDLSRNNNYGGGIWRIDALSALEKLEYLDLNNNYISDLSPIGRSTGLRYLDIHDNKISDISVLANMKGLQTAYLYRNKLTDISALSGLDKLEILHLRENMITDLSALLGLRCLSELNVLSNPLSGHACRVQIPQIILNNPGINIVYPECGQPKLILSSTPGGSIVQPGEGVFEYPYGHLIKLLAEPLPGFAFSGWKGSYSATANPIYLTMDQDHQIKACFIRLGAVTYVDDDAPGDPGPADPFLSDPMEDGSSAHPFDSIRKAIELCMDGTAVIVRPGRYDEAIDLSGRSINLLGYEPNSAELISFPIISGKGDGPVIRIYRSGSTIAGFIISRAGTSNGEVILCQQANPVIQNCLIVGNRNTAADGATIRCEDSHARFVHCTIADNMALAGCIHLIDSPVLISHCIIWSNTPRQILVEGQGLPDVRFTCIMGRWDGIGNMDVDPLFARAGQWRWDEDGMSWQQGDYHLRSEAGRWDPDGQMWVIDPLSSLCIDAGDPAVPIGLEPFPNGGRVNIGAYGGTPQASKSGQISID